MTLRRIAASLVSALFAAAVLFVPSAAFAQSKIAVIDVRRAVLETEEGLRVQATLKKLADARNTELDQKSKQLETDKASFDKKVAQGKTDKAILQKEAEALQKAFQEVQLLNAKAQNEIQVKEQELTAPIYKGILEISRRIATTEGYEMIVDKPAVPYFRADLEITDRAIQMYNSGQFSAAGPAPKAPSTPSAPAPSKPAQPAPQKPAAPAPKK